MVNYEYDGLGNLTSVTESDGRTTTYQYDGMGRVVRMDCIENIEMEIV